ncbi:MAG: DUF3450 family protein [Gammaproteobacteria bacterium]
MRACHSFRRLFLRSGGDDKCAGEVNRIANASVIAGATLALVFFAWPTDAKSVAAELETRLGNHDAARDVQRQIDTLSGQRVSVAATLADQRLADELANARAQLEQARSRNQTLGDAVAAKREARAGMRPLLEQMLDLLDASIAADLPFERSARQDAVRRARLALDDSSLRMTDRIDLVLKLYERELKSGYEIRVGQQQLDIDQQVRLVSVLAVGRVALYAVNDAGTECHVFRRAQQSWQPLTRPHCLALAGSLDDPTVAALRDLPVSVDAR